MKVEEQHFKNAHSNINCIIRCYLCQFIPVAMTVATGIVILK